jgi:hypothetical protein
MPTWRAPATTGSFCRKDNSVFIGVGVTRGVDVKVAVKAGVGVTGAVAVDVGVEVGTPSGVTKV